MRWVGVIGASLVLAPPASAGLPNPCALLTNAEAAKVLGSHIVMRDVSGNGKYRSCKWTGKNLAGPNALPSQRTLMVQVTQGTKAQFEKNAKQTQGAIRIKDIGEAAFASGGAVQYLDVQQHGYTLWIVASLVTDPLGAEKTAAKTAVARL